MDSFLNNNNNQDQQQQQQQQGSDNYNNNNNNNNNNDNNNNNNNNNQQQQSGQQQDALDKGVNAALNQFGFGGNAAVTEQVSDGLRSAFKSATGKDFPIADK